MPRSSENSGAISFSKPSQNSPKMAAKSSPSQPKATWQDVEANDWAILKTCRRFFRGADVDDAAQQSRIRILSRLHLFAGEAKLSTWMHKVTVNECLCIIRSRKAKMRDGEISLDFLREQQRFDAPADIADPLRGINAEQSISILRAVPALAVHLRRVSLIAEGCTYQDVAHMEGVSITTVKSRILRSRQRLLGMLASRKPLAGHVTK